MPFDLGSILGSSATGWSLGYDIVANDRTGSGTSSAISNLASVGIIAKTLASDVTNAFLSMGDKAQQFDTSVAIAAYRFQTSAQQIRSAAASISDEVTTADQSMATMNELARQGLGSDEAKEAARNFDTLGVAVGRSGAQMVNELAPSFHAFGISLTDNMEQLDQFAYLVEHSTYNADELASTLERVAPELDGMNVSYEDTIAILGALADKGIDGRRAFTALEQAARDAAPDIDALNDKLADTADRLDDAQASGEKLDIQIAAAERDVKMALAKYQMGGDVTGYSSVLDAQDRLNELKIDKQESDEKIAKLEGEKTDLQGQITSAGTTGGGSAAFYQELQDKYGISKTDIEAYAQTMQTNAPGTSQDIADIIKENMSAIDTLYAKAENVVFELGAGSEIKMAGQALDIGKDVGLTALVLKSLGLGGGTAGAAGAGTSGAAGAGGLGLGTLGPLAGILGAGAILGFGGVGVLEASGALNKVEEAGGGLEGMFPGMGENAMRYNPVLGSVVAGGAATRDIWKILLGEQGVDIYKDIMTTSELTSGVAPGTWGGEANREANKQQNQSFVFNFNIDKMTPDYDAKKLFDDFQRIMYQQRKSAGG